MCFFNKKSKRAIKIINSLRNENNELKTKMKELEYKSKEEFNNQLKLIKFDWFIAVSLEKEKILFASAVAAFGFTIKLFDKNDFLLTKLIYFISLNFYIILSFLCILSLTHSKTYLQNILLGKDGQDDENKAKKLDKFIDFTSILGLLFFLIAMIFYVDQVNVINYIEDTGRFLIKGNS